jgi:hypothetical protein
MSPSTKKLPPRESGDRDRRLRVSQDDAARTLGTILDGGNVMAVAGVGLAARVDDLAILV